MDSPSLKKAQIDHFKGLQEISKGLYYTYNNHGWYRCQKCGQMWASESQTGEQDKLPDDWWKCPNGCNTGINDK